MVVRYPRIPQAEGGESGQIIDDFNVLHKVDRCPTVPPPCPIEPSGSTRSLGRWPPGWSTHTLRQPSLSLAAPTHSKNQLSARFGRLRRTFRPPSKPSLLIVGKFDPQLHPSFVVKSRRLGSRLRVCTFCPLSCNFCEAGALGRRSRMLRGLSGAETWIKLDLRCILGLDRVSKKKKKSKPGVTVY